MTKTKKTRINVFLLKEGTTFQEAVEPDNNSQTTAYNENIRLVYAKSVQRTPPWLQRLFPSNTTELSVLQEVLINSTSRLLILSKVDDRLFAVVFGYGKSLLNSDRIETRFGLKTALSLINKDSVRFFDTDNLSSSSKNSTILNKKGGMNEADWGVSDILLKNVGGVSTNSYFGKNISGRDSFISSVEIDLNKLPEYLEKCLEVYQSNRYKTHFDFIDWIEPVNDGTLLDTLNNKMLDKIKKLFNIFYHLTRSP